MKKQIRLLGLFSVLAASVLPSMALAFVSAMPSYFDFGSLTPGRSGMMSVTFMNNSAQPVRFFNVNCNGDSSVFSCFSGCFMLQPYGSCTVQVQFSPRNGDDQRKMVWLNGTGDGQFATSTVYGTDRKPPKP